MSDIKIIEVLADWVGLERATVIGHLIVRPGRGEEIFSFEYSADWLKSEFGQMLDPALRFYPGPQYPNPPKTNFGLFLDSCPDRWGRRLMLRREAQLARAEKRAERQLRESDFLLGVHDGHRMGALRYRYQDRILHDDDTLAAPPWTSLRELQNASLKLEREGAEDEPNFGAWLKMLLAPGGSLGGARPKASVQDEYGRLWIAKFPSGGDEDNVGAWEYVVHQLARGAGVSVPPARLERFGTRQQANHGHHTFLSRRFDRTDAGGRVHFASAMTLLEHQDGHGADDGASYLELAEFLMTHGSSTSDDLEQLWRRIVFSICVSNTDDHLRNHGFLLGLEGWCLAPAYDINPNAQGSGLKLNISQTDNTQDLELARQVASSFRINATRASEIISEVIAAVTQWRSEAAKAGLSTQAQDRVARAFRIAEIQS